MLRNTLALIFHLLPLAPLTMGHAPAAGALILMLLALYIKDKKLGAMEAALVARSVAPYPDAVSKELGALRAARRRWQYLQLPWFRGC